MSESDGFIYGGNGSNCLTWMDKMGSSQKSGNKGKPATPRNGAPIEMTCILKKCLSFVIKLADYHHYKHKSVVVNNKKLHFKDWLELIQDNFEKKYFIPLDKNLDEKYNVNSSLVRRRGIYRDVIGTFIEKDEY